MIPLDVTLVSMPFAEVQRPSIALGLLQASLGGTGIRSEVVYGNLRFAETIGVVAYQAIQATPTDHLLGEWCFAERLLSDAEGLLSDAEGLLSDAEGLLADAEGLLADAAGRDDEYLDLVLDVRCHGFPANREQRKSLVRWMRAQAAPFVDRLAQDIVARGPRIVGCTSMFQQHCASLRLLKRIRELSPATVLVMGGANCEGPMGVETLRACPWVDCVVSGEADALFPDLCRALLEHGRAVDPRVLPYGAISQAHLPGVGRAESPHALAPPRPLIRDLDALPTPDYDDYFDALRASTLSTLIRPGLLAESSRGCWWGEKSHCTFCGLNGTGMKYRSKSPERVLTELGELSRRYGVNGIQFVDNILDMSYFRTMLPRLAAEGSPYALFYETKANLRREQVKLLADAGVRWIQPGIESLDDNVLRLIGKGNSTLINLQLLKWCSEFGINAAWNMLSGVPGESDSWYAAMAEWLPAIFHLQPPSGVNRVRYDRFSPYHTRARDFGLTLQPSRAYAYVYPLPRESLMELAYSFEDERQPGHVHRGLPGQPGQQKLQAAVEEWNDRWHTSRPVLRVRDEGDRLDVVDTRPCARQRTWTSGALEAEIYRLCDSAQAPASVLNQLRARHGREVPAPEVDAAIEALCRANLVLCLNGKLLGVGVRAPTLLS